MSKKAKNQAAAPVANEVATGTPEVKTAFGKPIAPKLVVTRADGFEYGFTKWSSPKLKRASAGKVTIDGQESDVQFTNNSGTAPSDSVLDYAWFSFGDTYGYITFARAQPDHAFPVGTVATIREAGDKPVAIPTRESTEKAKAGYAASAAALAAKRAAAKPVAAEGEAEEQAEEQADEQA
jgi:hypothetical protein